MLEWVEILSSRLIFLFFLTTELEPDRCRHLPAANTAFSELV